MMTLSALIRDLGRSLLRIENRLLRAAGLQPLPAPALAVNGPGLLSQLQPQGEPAEPRERQEQQPPPPPPGLTDGFLWMAAPKSRRTIEVNRTRRRAEQKMLKPLTNIEPCPECGHLKQKHVLCGFCYSKVAAETSRIRGQMLRMEAGPLRAPPTETVVLYEGEKPRPEDEDKRIVERPRKRPHWFSF